MPTAPVILEETFHAPLEKIWKAITEKEEMKHWYFDLKAFEAVKGFEFQFQGGTPEKQYLHLCEVLEVFPMTTLIYSWKYDGYAGESFVAFDLSIMGDETLLRLTHSGLETFPPDVADFARENFEKGWNHIIHTSLKNYIEQSN